jgi:putative Holliday junction resolvase
MGIDFGRVRIGIAISDELRMLARPLTIVRWGGKEPPVQFISELVRRHEIHEVLVGLPRNMNGSEGPSAEQARGFAGVLARSCEVAVRLMDERLSSREAYRTLLVEADASKPARRRRAADKLDAHAAAVILQRYLDGEPAMPVNPGSGFRVDEP